MDAKVAADLHPLVIQHTGGGRDLTGFLLELLEVGGRLDAQHPIVAQRVIERPVDLELIALGQVVRAADLLDGQRISSAF